MYEETLGIVNFHKVGRTLLKGLHKVLIVKVLYDVGKRDPQVHNNLLHFRSFAWYSKEITLRITCSTLALKGLV